MSLSKINDEYGRKIGFVKNKLAKLSLFFSRLGQFEKIEWNRVQRLVFICKGNICRSAFGHAFAKSISINCASAGLEARTGDPANPTAMKYSQALDVNLNNHKTSRLDDFVIREGDLFICMEPQQAFDVQFFLKNHPNKMNAQVTLIGLHDKKKRIYLQDPYGLEGAYWITCFEIIKDATYNIVKKSSQLNAAREGENNEQ